MFSDFKMHHLVAICKGIIVVLGTCVPPSFKGTMKSSILKAVTQTQFETCVTTSITLDFKLRLEK